MSKILRPVWFTALILLTIGCSRAPKKPSSNLPRSHEAVLLEVTSPAEVMIRATGIGVYPPGTPERKRNRILDRSANIDAERAALWLLLFGGTDPLLQTQEEKARFQAIAEDFFDRKNIRKYITWSAREYENRFKIAQGRKLKIEKVVKVNKALLKEDLVNHGVISSTQELLSRIGTPLIMVIPQKKGDLSPLQILQRDDLAQHTARAIESFLTARGYEVIVPQQQNLLSTLSFSTSQNISLEEDFNYYLAQSIGSDVYLAFNYQITRRHLGTSKVQKASVGIQAFETTTARLLGTETGYSEERTAPGTALLEEACNQAMENLLSRIDSYWKRDLKKGIQYKLILSLSPKMNPGEREQAAFTMSDVLRHITQNYRELVSTDQTIEYLLWVDASSYGNSRDLLADLFRVYTDFQGPGQLVKVIINRKLIHLKLIP